MEMAVGPGQRHLGEGFAEGRSRLARGIDHVQVHHVVRFAAKGQLEERKRGDRLGQSRRGQIRAAQPAKGCHTRVTSSGKESSATYFGSAFGSFY